ncbi:MAG: hypothetical protein ACLRTA_05100 [Clostridia bacterium]
MKKKNTFKPIGLKIEATTSWETVIKSLLVTELPTTIRTRLLSSCVSNPEIKVFMRTEPLDLDCAGMLKKEYNERAENIRRAGTTRRGEDPGE